MKKRTVYLLKVQPAGYNNAIELSFDFVPTTADVVKVINDLSRSTKRDEFKELCDKCVKGLNCWGLPKITDGSSFMQWKTKGESLYSSKGITAVKPIVCYSKEK